MTQATGALFIVNDDPDLAIAVGADGVHLGPDDLSPSEARRMAPDGFIIGGSAGTVERALALEADGVDYLGVGAIYDAHLTKPTASPPRGVGVIREIGSRVSIPLVAIGGITPDNAAEALRAGADGIAVVRAILDARSPEGAVEKLLK
jgi:thiamine-phosphate pyrophosphorylase